MKLFLIGLIIGISLVFIAGFGYAALTDLSVEQVLNLVFDSSTNTLKLTLV